MTTAFRVIKGPGIGADANLPGPNLWPATLHAIVIRTVYKIVDGYLTPVFPGGIHPGFSMPPERAMERLPARLITAGRRTPAAPVNSSAFRPINRAAKST